MLSEIEIEEVAQDVMQRLQDATGDVANALMEFPDDYLGDYGDEFKERAKRIMHEMWYDDAAGALADMVYNEDGFLDMARDWIWEGSRYDDASFDAVCEKMASMWPQKADLFRSWKHGRKEVRDEGTRAG